MDGTAAAPRHPDRSGDLTKLGHVPALDGLRGLAVAAVLLFHGGVSWAPGGFLGVDVFFVLSGFLITTLLLEEAAEDGRVSLAAFWTRRARRLIPALAVTCIAVVVAAPWIAEGRSPVSVRYDAAAALSYVANWRFILTDTAYFDRTAGPSPLEHTWSLGVEEQFYVLWPIVAIALLRRESWRLGIVALAGVVASVGAMALAYDAPGDTSRAYFGTDSRVHVVLVGCALAVLLRRWRLHGIADRIWLVPARVVGVGAALTLLVGAIGTTSGDDEWLYRAGGFALVAVATGLLIAEVTLARTGLVATVLAVPPLRALGVISYGTYLWHWPVFLYLTSARTGLDGVALFASRIGATLAIALASYGLVEQPIRRGVVLRGLRAGAVLPALAVLAAGVIVLDAQRVSDADETALVEPVVVPPLPVPAADALRVLVLGDSVAMTLGHWLRAPAAEAGVVIEEHAILGCGIARGGPFRYFGAVDQQPAECEDWPQRWGELLVEERPHVVLLIVGRWEVMDRTHEGEWRHVGQPEFDTYLRRELELAVEVLATPETRLVVATAPYYRRGERPDGGIWPEDEPARVDRFNEIVRAVAAAHPDRVTVVDLNAQTTATPGGYTRDVAGVRLRSDGVHFTRDAGRHLAPWILPEIQRLVVRR